jgi:hypothetical protein
MIDKQKIRARMEACEEAGVAMTNYGLFLAYAHAPAAFLRAIMPWGVNVPPALLASTTAAARNGGKEEATGDVSCEAVVSSPCVLKGGLKGMESK